MKELFLLDPDVTFLNHGSFGATPKAVMDVYQEWLLLAEKEPVVFFGSAMYGYLAEARAALGAYVGVAADDIAYVPNATTGVNIVARSLLLQPDDEIIETNHVYGACDKTFQFVCGQTGAQRVMVDIPMPSSDEEMVEAIWAAVTPRTKLIFLSHMTSPTALTIPVAEICRRAREAGILTLIDGAHVPGQLDLDIGALGSDFYTGNCHKWLNSPKHAGFLHVRPEHQAMIEPVVTSWGWTPPGEASTEHATTGSQFLDRLQLQGTREQAAYLSVPAAIEFQREHDWSLVRARCHELVNMWMAGMAKLTGLPSLYTHEGQYGQFGAVELPQSVGDVRAFKQQMYDEFRVQMPILQWGDKKMARISVQGYNDSADIETALEAFSALL